MAWFDMAPHKSMNEFIHRIFERWTHLEASTRRLIENVWKHPDLTELVLETTESNVAKEVSDEHRTKGARSEIQVDLLSTASKNAFPIGRKKICWQLRKTRNIKFRHYKKGKNNETSTFTNPRSFRIGDREFTFQWTHFFRVRPI